MDVIIVLLIIVFAFVTSGKGKNAKPPATRKAAPKRATQVKRQVRQATAKLDEIKDAFTVPEPEAEPMEAVEFAQGASLADDEGCVGGSMEHVHTEGETHEEHRRHVEALRAREAEETRAAEAASELAAMNLRKLRQAVVMAEVLDKPVALRGNRRRSA